MLCFGGKLFTLVALLSLSCLTSAFSTRFIMEGAEKEQKNGEEGKAQKAEKSDEIETVINPQNVEVKVIPLTEDVLFKTADLVSITPAKLAVALSAQSLLMSIQNIPIKGNTAQDFFNTIQDLIKEINKTAEIIQLTAQFVNISSQYILSSLDQFIKSGCDASIVEKEIGSIHNTFLKSITKHIEQAVEDLNNKTNLQDMTGSDVLVSSSAHIVAAFQEMTYKVLALTTKYNNNCGSPLFLMANDEQNQTVDAIRNHQTIKKDKADSNLKDLTEKISKVEDMGDDVTLEVFPYKFYSPKDKADVDKTYEKDTLKVPVETKLENVPFTLLFDNTLVKEQNKNGNTNNLNRENTFAETAKSPQDNKLDTIPLSETTPKITPKSLFNMVELLTNGIQSSHKKPIQQCDEHVEPVCGIDEKNNRFIIFLNDCKRGNHNNVHGTNYVWFSMDTCVGIMLRNPGSTTKVARTDDLTA